MFEFINKMFVGLLSITTVISFGKSLVFNFKGPIKCVSLNNQPAQTRPKLVNINSDETLFYLFTISVNKCKRSYNTINDSYAGGFVPNKVKNMNVKLFNLMSEINETRFLVQHESCEYKCGLNESVCNSKQKFNPDECRCKCKELDNWDSCKDDCMWNPGTCDCECNKQMNI